MHAPNPNTYDTAGAPSLTNLDAQQVQAATLLTAGQSYSEVAQTLSLGRTTLYRWRQLPEFAAYLNILIKQAADETLLQATCLLTTSLKLVRQRLEDPNTSPAEQARLALRLLSLYSNPAFLKFLNTREDDPNDLTNAQMLVDYRAHKDDDPVFDPSDRQLFLCSKHDQLHQAQAFDAKHPGAARVIPAGKAGNEFPKDKATKTEQIGTPARRSMALDAAISGVLPQIAAVR